MNHALPPNPVGATRPREFLCMESKPVDAGGMQLHLLLLLDAYSFACLGHSILLDVGPKDYIALLHQVGQEHDLHDDVTLLCDLPPDQLHGLRELFPQLLGVRHDPHGVAAITEEARRFLMARLVAMPGN